VHGSFNSSCRENLNSGNPLFLKPVNASNVEIAKLSFTTIDANHGVTSVCQELHARAGVKNLIAAIAGKG